MKAVQVFALAGFVSLSVAQELAPSPTESIGCEPHGDHWHCEGPRETDAPAEEVSLAPSPTESIGCEPHGDHWHCEGPRPTEEAQTTADAEASESAVPSLAPSPVESVGCEPHGDHWHCDGPRVTESPAAPEESSAAPGQTTSAEHDHDHDHDSGSGSLAPSPTESVGCEPHGDHWHCDGPATPSGDSPSTINTITTTSAPASGSSTPAPSPAPEGAASSFRTSAVGAIAVAALFAAFFV